MPEMGYIENWFGIEFHRQTSHDFFCRRVSRETKSSRIYFSDNRADIGKIEPRPPWAQARGVSVANID